MKTNPESVTDNIKHFTNQQPHLLSEILADELSVDAKKFSFLLQFGAIYVNNERQIKDKFVLQKSELRVHLAPRRYNCDYPWNDLVVFENDFFLVLNKPAGVPSHPSVDNVVENALTQTSLARGYPLFVTHRLDAVTAGLIVYGKKSTFVTAFNLQMQKRGVHKKYVALVESTKPLRKTLTHYMDPGVGTPKKLSEKSVVGWQLCELEILAQKEFSKNVSEVKINLLTGRTHQIRAQLSQVGAPVVGDSLYGAKTSFGEQAIALRSCEIDFESGGKRMHFVLPETW